MVGSVKHGFNVWDPELRSITMATAKKAAKKAPAKKAAAKKKPAAKKAVKAVKKIIPLFKT